MTGGGATSEVLKKDADSVQGLAALKNVWALLGVVVVVECFLALVIYNLLKIYIDRMNAAVGFFAKIGRNIWDGSKVAVQMSSDLGWRVAGGGVETKDIVCCK